MPSQPGGRQSTLAAVLAATALLAAALASCGGSSGHPSHRGISHPSATGQPTRHHRIDRKRQSTPAPPFAVGRTTLVLIDHRRTETLPGGTRIPRRLRTLVFYPRVSARVTFPLLVFGHGFAVTPLTYGALLQYWAAQGFVVAAPFFPLESRNAPGGPDESDLPNQPGDMSFLITRMLSISAHGSGALSHLVDPHQIAVSGQSDGGDTALAVAYGAGRYRDPRIGAAVILSGAEIPGLTLSYFFPGEPPLLAVQGTADPINPPSLTAQFFAAARPPKYLLALSGARHLPPYQRAPDLSIVERVTVAFLRRYLEHDAAAGRQLPTLGNVPGRASLTAVPR